jgi:hypothetical protein
MVAGETCTSGYGKHDLTDYSWDRPGLDDACNVSRPFAKVVNAPFLINYALSDNYIPQWHSTEDYRNSSRAAESAFHDDIYYRLVQQMGTAEANSETGRETIGGRGSGLRGIFLWVDPH